MRIYLNFLTSGRDRVASRVRPASRSPHGTTPPGQPLISTGPLSQRTRLGNGTGGLQPQRRGVDPPPARPASVPRPRWTEDGLAGFCDIERRLCVASALRNGEDRFLKDWSRAPACAGAAPPARASWLLSGERLPRRRPLGRSSCRGTNRRSRARSRLLSVDHSGRVGPHLSPWR